MADWTAYDPNDLLPGEPWTAALALAAFENPESIAEGAAGAPPVRPAALDGFFIGHLLSVEGAAFGFTDVLPLTVRAHLFVTSSSVGSGAVQIRLSEDGGVNWSDWENIMSIGNFPSFVAGVVVVDMASGEWRSVGSSNLSGTIAGANFNAIQWRGVGADKVFGVHASYMERAGNV